MNRFPLVRLLCPLLIAAAGCAQIDHNFRAVDEGRFYRSAQMTDVQLGSTIRRHGIKTVVNLRGAPDESWNKEERELCEALGVAHYDLKWTMAKLPEPASLLEYVRIVEAAPQPVLVHCHAGVHRAGAASAVYVLHQGGDPATARDQFGFFFRDAPIGELVTLYEGSKKDFATWVAEDYPAIYAAKQNQ